MPRGRTTGSKNIQFFKYALMTNGGWEYFTSQRAICDRIDINRTMLSRVINHPELVQNCDVVCEKLDPPLPVFRKEREGRTIKYTRIIYDPKGNHMEAEIQQEAPLSSDEEPQYNRYSADDWN